MQQDMNTKAPTTAAELLAEWKRLDAIVAPLYKSIEEIRDFATTLVIDSYTKQMRPIAARLDGMCEDAGIEIIRMGASKGYFFSYSRWTNLDSIKIQAKPHLVASEQQALQEWLLIKAQI